MHRVEVHIKDNLADTSGQALVKAGILLGLTSQQELTLTTNDLGRFCYKTGSIFALIPHPKHHNNLSQHPKWLTWGAEKQWDGLKLFQNAVHWIKGI
jgi:phosphoribosylformylglycinamidine (FGAM) synthase-like amidotransferase family enzyme